ncbi:procollagen-lysine,2-oxoglutarate 5-dioxygenase 1 isoform X1 [Trichogramma pretiosum]|uniref:procollagen-lysine,2-oxoglutarate 5-dioxygenase 1 isoform X1 n=2 Tax=Trichogramma pretiosum TaxID=7493 RepID=UPI0006C943FD|nr:procollagen-lysine,2-oxoglutarate 5-dioxygenase 1 isoform X1 [Trichogramma pretiosum]XP_014231001.1 procollagen-lysine,2-oxoglutarate 5-dioxygenase 1 isoform X1 [Trichogramma pretiosum]XP_014231002.1 procollagen-lysine,2-oxoglutarate 5-dioxygenase 1 isoform X1 [Trichogramma pretiosum]XP_014231003.1 procollagen-lysine,2-oxoglutarate 5-dioxygenase 1 isoform X1 [Trichogramma pretiosum]XP_014231004.1 procollagen-lysine,2-oxoglutarate 5-dioxygenase 1 isoform X1 [Trichogramma pretiosum]XP_0233172
MRPFELCLIVLFLFDGLYSVASADNEHNNDAIVFTVATNATDGFQRYIRSTEVNGFRKQVRVLGMGQAWRGGDVQRYAGGGHKVNLLKEALEPYKDDLDRVVLFTDSYDVIFLKNLEVIIAKFKEWKDEPRVIFSAEEYCWPDKKLAAQYPEVARGKRYLNSGGFIGYASDIYSMISSVDIDDGGDDQLFFTKMYLDQDTRSKHNIKLDHKSEIFQNLNGASYDIELRFKGEEAYVQNTAYNTVPMILHGNGYSKLLLNSLGNYVAQSWNSEEGCISCWDNTVELEGEDPNSFPTILVALFIEKPTPFLEEFFEKISKQKYPKEKLHLLVHNKVDYHNELIQAFIEEHEGKYKSIKQIRPEDEVSEAIARDLAVDRCLMLKCSGYFSVDSEAHLDNENTLRLLVEQQRGIVAPLLVRPFKAWSNFWGAITDDGFYARSTDYMDIIHNERRGLWNVPFISNCYLVNATLLAHEDTRPVYEDPELDPDMSFASAYRRRNVFMYVSNRLDFGHLVNPDSYNVSLTHPDMYQLFDNKLDWEKRYIHENYSKNFEADRAPLQPCPDVFWFPILTRRFTKEWINIMENYGKWSDGSNYDPRLSDGYENVPTRDIHMNQVGLEAQWLYFLQNYVRPLQELVYLGYYHFPPRSLMNFVVRYRPDEQPSLKPHHDSSTYTINVALNEVGVDYEGGGCRFIRYNCSVTDTKPGWMLMHPGRLTHYHEGLRVTKGTRYIMISFVDP